MKANNKIKEMEEMKTGLQRLYKLLWGPLECIYKLRKETTSSIDLIDSLMERMRRADKKDLSLVSEIITNGNTIDTEMLIRFFECVISELEKTQSKIREEMMRLKETETEIKNSSDKVKS